MRVALDTNILAYISNVDRADDDAGKIIAALAIVRKLESRHTIVVAIQALGELFSVLTKAGMRRSDARTVVQAMGATVETAASDYPAFLRALDLAVDHRLQLWDALILTVSADARCDLFLTEDLQDGFRVRGMTIVNPFATPMQPILATLLAG